MLAAVILAAGESSRMGTPKALLPFPTAEEATADFADSAEVRDSHLAAKSFLGHLLEVSNHPQIGLQRVVVGAHEQAIRAAFPYLGDALIVNHAWQRGQLSSLKAAIRSLGEANVSGALVFLVDHPLVTRRLVDTLIRRFQESGAPVVVPVHGGRRGHPVIFSAAVFSELLAAPEGVGARAVVREHASEAIHVETEEKGILLNLNAPESLAEARDLVRARRRDFLT